MEHSWLIPLVMMALCVFMMGGRNARWLPVNR
jgi:hypothetical protein